MLNDQLGKNTDAMNKKIRKRDEFDETISNTESNYTQLMDSTKMLTNVLKVINKI